METIKKLISDKNYFIAMTKSLDTENQLIKKYVIENIPDNLVFNFMELAIQHNDEYIILAFLTEDNIVEYIEDIIFKCQDFFIENLLSIFADILVNNLYIMNSVIPHGKRWVLKILFNAKNLNDDITEFLLNFEPHEIREILNFHSYLEPTEDALNRANLLILDIYLDHLKSPKVFYKFNDIQSLGQRGEKILNKILRCVWLDDIPMSQLLIDEKLKIRYLLQEISDAKQEYQEYENMKLAIAEPDEISDQGWYIINLILDQNKKKIGNAQRHLRQIGNHNFDY